jgi:uncharacterized phage protein (TIGR01671 family)
MDYKQRIIKFRIWSKKYQMFDHNPMWPNNQNTHETFLLDRNGDLREFITCDGENFFWDLINNTKEDLIIQQFTGLLDKNQKEIYEGDILNQVLDNKPCYYLVEWSNQSEYCGFGLRAIMKRDGSFKYTIHDFKNYLAEGFEILGNIFENPELIKK